MPYLHTVPCHPAVLQTISLDNLPMNAWKDLLTCVRSRKWNAHSSAGSPSESLGTEMEPQSLHLLHRPEWALPIRSSC